MTHIKQSLNEYIHPWRADTDEPYRNFYRLISYELYCLDLADDDYFNKFINTGVFRAIDKYCIDRFIK